MPADHAHAAREVALILRRQADTLVAALEQWERGGGDAADGLAEAARQLRHVGGSAAAIRVIFARALAAGAAPRARLMPAVREHGGTTGRKG
jgi:hypothetical protein